MKPVQIDFVQPRAWRVIWACALALVLIMATATGAMVWQLQQKQAALQAKLSALQAQQRQAQLVEQKPLPEAAVNPRANSETMARRLFQRDWNHLFDAIETPTLAKVRLVQLSMEAVSGQAMLEYELDSMEHASAVTQALNEASRTGAAWQLERLDNGPTSSNAPPPAKVKGVWRSVVE